MIIPAFYAGLQPGFRHLPAIELYTLIAPVGGHPVGSTVSRQTLEKHGFVVQSRRSRSKAQRLAERKAA